MILVGWGTSEIFSTVPRPKAAYRRLATGDSLPGRQDLSVARTT
ncbi:hypothetical protein WME90_21725 [Sorangium sp. So ce375]